ncbi:hypothetical protein [Cryobacterium luteum]|uniref:Uncharacterized protein n=1 Tax=Cryobacterium luteum TaxID=1424661 RepID=A0A1H8L8S3_9MICO|nr:hypothetical protein [Cryobacterium luteum]TFB94437.1 hypothetical protein E3O10_01285 [Cryobacterium luteum]SEO01196.1 type VII secretion effector, SACOL2603 family [Cryobacterium luteum]
MRIDYSALEDAAKALAAAASQVNGEPTAPGELGSGAAAPNDAHRNAASGRRSTLNNLSELMTAQSKSCTEMTTLFKLLDAQIASQVNS